MNSRGKSVKLALVILSISLAFFLGGGCSNEEQYEAKRAKRVVRIKTPPLKKDSALESEAGESEKKASLKDVRAPSAVKTETSPPQKERPEPGKAEKVGAYRYKVQGGDTLFKIAGRKEVYNDPMKWPSLFRLNMDKLDQMKAGEGLQHKELAKGLELRFIAPSEAAENLDKLGRKPWVINVMSVQSPRRIGPAVIALMKKGYRVYLTKARVKGKDWVRVRVGFFKDSSEADAVRKEIMPMVNDAWLGKIGNRELEKFGGY